MWKIFGRVRAFLARIFQSEETDEDGELFDRELEIEEENFFVEKIAEIILPSGVPEIIEVIVEIEGEDYEEENEVLADLEQAMADAESLLASLDRDDDTEIEVDEPDFNYPDWVDDSAKNEIYNTLGITDYDDLTDSEKDDYIPGWLGFEISDEPAGDDTRETYEIMEDIAYQLNIPPDVAIEMSLEELVRLVNIADNVIETMRDIEQLDPHAIAEELDIDFLYSFGSWEDFLSSRIYETFVEHPEWLSINVYYDEDGELEIDIYESEDISP